LIEVQQTRLVYKFSMQRSVANLVALHADEKWLWLIAAREESAQPLQLRKMQAQEKPDTARRK